MSSRNHLSDNELDALLVRSLSRLPNYAPTRAFADKVMNRVQLPAPRPVLAYRRARLWLSQPRRALTFAGAYAAFVVIALFFVIPWLIANSPAIAFAADRLSQFLLHFSLSDTIETEPVGQGLEGQPRYLNAAATGETTLDARALLDALLQIERNFGRERPYRQAPRTLDLDLILFGDQVIDAAGLHVPHPRFRDRLFVLIPAAQIAPDLRDPVTGLTIAELVHKKSPRA